MFLDREHTEKFFKEAQIIHLIGHSVPILDSNTEVPKIQDQELTKCILLFLNKLLQWEEDTKKEGKKINQDQELINSLKKETFLLIRWERKKEEDEKVEKEFQDLEHTSQVYKETRQEQLWVQEQEVLWATINKLQDQELIYKDRNRKVLNIQWQEENKIKQNKSAQDQELTIQETYTLLLPNTNSELLKEEILTTL